MTVGKQAMAFLVGMIALVIVVREVRLRTTERLEVAAALAGDSVDAARDTTRVVVTDDVDSVRVWERRAIQAEQRADDLDRALRRERVVRAEVRVSTARLDTNVTLPAPGRDTVIRRAPYTLYIEAPSASSADTGGGVGLRVVTDTLTLGVRIGCGALPRLGVRQAFVSVSAPSWARVALERVEQEPSVCNPSVAGPSGAGGVIRGVLRRLGVSVGYGAVTTGAGVLSVRPTIGIGVRVWP